jgi:hypothetical protein
MWGLDAFYDQPVGAGNGITFQVDYNAWDGGTTIALPRQDTFLAEAGFFISSLRLLPYLQYAQRNFDARAGNDEDKVQIGVGYFFNGHNANIKGGWGRIDHQVGETQDQIVAQFQLFLF